MSSSWDLVGCMRELNDDNLYRFRGLKRWNYNKRVAVSYKDDVSNWTVAN